MRTLRLFPILTLLLVLAGLTPLHQAAAQDSSATLLYDGVERRYTLHLPAGYDPESSYPLLIALHGVASSGKALQALSGLDAVADTYGFIVAYPDSQTFYWDDGRTAVNLPPVLETVDDVGFLDALLAELESAYAVDSARIYLTGIQNGGTMAYRMACELGNRYAGIAIVGTLMWGYLDDFCSVVPQEDRGPVDVLLIHGSADHLYPAEGTEYAEMRHPDGSPHHVLGLTDTLNYWRMRNGCDLSEAGDPVPGTLVRFSACADDSSVTYYGINGGGHSWSRSGDFILNAYGVDVGDLVGRFVSGAELPPPPERAYRAVPRSYVTYVPPRYDPAEPMPLVLALHGRPGTGSSFAYITDLNPVAAENGFIVVYPDGLNYEWNYTGDLWGVPGYDQDDVYFLRSLISDLGQMLNIDQARLYVTGFSNGGFMTQRLACEAPHQFAAFAAVGSTMYYSVSALCEGTAPAPMLLMHGTEDLSIPWEGVTNGVAGQYISLSVVDTMGFWVLHNGCDTQSQFAEIPVTGNSPGTQVVRHTFSGCSAGAEVVFYVIAGGGHNWPGVPGRISEEIAGNVNMDINAGQVIWEFFAQHTRDLEP